jgi:hypothetical protein
MIGGTNISEQRNKSPYTREHKNITQNKKKKEQKNYQTNFWNKRNKSA